MQFEPLRFGKGPNEVGNYNLVTRPINKKVPFGPFFIYSKGQMRTGEAKFDKIVGKNKQSAVRTVTFWKGAQRSWELQSGHPCGK